MNPEPPAPFRSGMVALIGKPNVGKSTLLNRIVGQKVSIVSNKPQTTRRRVMGIVNGAGYQIVFIDTPGIHEAHTTLAKSMVEQARGALADVDAILVVADGSHHPGEVDKQIAKLVVPTTRAEEPSAEVDQASEAGTEIAASASGRPADGPHLLLCLNKMDLLKAEDVERNVAAYTALYPTEKYMLTTANRGHNVDRLVEMIVQVLPEGDPMYPEDEFTDQSSRFLVGELVREKILQATRQEIPHATAVLIDNWEAEGDLVRIEATIIVEKASQRAIIIGKGGTFLKKIGTEARAEIEELLGQRIFLGLHVKVQEGWRMNPRVLQELEYSE